MPDKWKEGASNTTEGGGRKINENKLLSKKNRFVFFFYIYILGIFYGFKTHTLALRPRLIVVAIRR